MLRGMLALDRRQFLALSALLALGCRMPGRGRPSVVCVLVDQLRLDAFDAWLPRTGDLARRGAVFRNMRAVAPWTYPSVVSMMSGLLPQQHGADGLSGEGGLARFSPEVPLVQRILREAGYRTAAFVTSPLLLDWNPFHQGFDSFHADLAGALPPPGGPALRGAASGAAVNRRIREHFDPRPPDVEEFSYVHYVDARAPRGDAAPAAVYEAAVRSLDERIVELYDYFAARYGGDMLFFVTSDHGRAVGLDRHLGYGRRWRASGASVHDFNLRIPFALLRSDRIRAGVEVDVPCSNVDFAPTLLDLLELRSDVVFAGRSLAPWVRGEQLLPDDRAIYARHSAFGRASDCLVYRGRKYVRFFEPGTEKVLRRRMFDLASDPDETRSLGANFGAVAAVLSEAAGTHGLAFDASRAPLPREAEGPLRALGYLDPASHGR
jgi:arylsulfatase A-like enzyme